MQNYTTILGIIGMREKKFSYRQCTARYHVGQGTVKLILDRFSQLGLSYEDLCQMTPDKVEQTFYPKENRSPRQFPFPDYQKVYERLHTTGSRLNLFYLWTEYKKDNPSGYQYTQYVEHYNRFVHANYGSRNVSMAVSRVPGEKVYIDWIGDQPKILVNRDTGELLPVHIFVTTVGVSSCIYAEAFADEKQTSFTSGTVHALEYYQAVPRYLVPDNCKTAVTKHTKDELLINSSYQDLENFYDVVILPPPSRKPKGKATVEKYVNYLETWLLERLKEHVYPDLKAVNRYIKEIIAAINAEIPRGWKLSRMEAFLQYDRPQMKPLTDGSFSLCDYKTFRRIPNNYHLFYDGHYYSVLYTYYGQPAILKATASEVKICDRNNRLICTHKRSYNSFPKYITDESHMPASHRYYSEVNNRDSSYYRNKADAIGPYMLQLIDAVLHSTRHEEQSYNSCNGILHSCDGISKVLADKAAQKCIELNTCKYSYFKRILSEFVNKEWSDRDALPAHSNIRGKEFYR